MFVVNYAVLSPEKINRMAYKSSLLTTLRPTSHRLPNSDLQVTDTTGRAIAQEVISRLPTAAVRVQSRVWSCGILWWTQWRWGRFSPRTSVSLANLHFICFSTIIFTITRGSHNRPGVAAVPIASQTRIKKKIYLFIYQQVRSFPPWRTGLKLGSSHVGFVVDKVALRQVFSKYFGFPCQYSFHHFLHSHHHLSPEAGTIGQEWPQCQ
jgi:hypothetical protein